LGYGLYIFRKGGHGAFEACFFARDPNFEHLNANIKNAAIGYKESGIVAEVLKSRAQRSAISSSSTRKVVRPSAACPRKMMGTFIPKVEKRKRFDLFDAAVTGAASPLIPFPARGEFRGLEV
jgi:hypothetical protein